MLYFPQWQKVSKLVNKRILTKVFSNLNSELDCNFGQITIKISSNWFHGKKVNFNDFWQFYICKWFHVKLLAGTPISCTTICKYTVYVVVLRWQFYSALNLKSPYLNQKLPNFKCIILIIFHIFILPLKFGQNSIFHILKLTKFEIWKNFEAQKFLQFTILAATTCKKLNSSQFQTQKFGKIQNMSNFKVLKLIKITF